MVTLAQVRDLSKRALPNADLSKLEESGGRIFGEIRDAAFASMSQDQRIEWLNKNVREPLGLQGTNVGLLLPLEPGEEPWQ